ncbi:MAG: acetyl-CoA hydrolase/transferase family protein [Saprospiraceae bacterium]|nr:acetyl-CoA hydrolase/transferase family protein [Saprospiraceae bacterium]MBK7811056.1 acetyl-CoA hydrolase/transferase family protein [Saprospiraceae bacterium]MBK9630660.1 acetyl-CoA hydrolase/transferase family protein [Saprospiraceae bacterium]
MKYSYSNVQQAVSNIQSGQRIFVHGSAATPGTLLAALEARAFELSNVEIVSLTTLGDMPLAKAEYRGSFYFNSVFVSSNIRTVVNDGMGSYIPVFLSEIPKLFYQKILPLDVALIHVSPPDAHGYCSLGVSVDISLAAVKSANLVIAQVNPKMPRTHGDGFLHASEINVWVETYDELPEIDYNNETSEVEKKIGQFCASLIEDGSTIQMGIGSIPNAVMDELVNHKDLGVHTEMFSDGVVDLLKKGVITNRYKKKHRRKVISTFAIGSRALYQFIDDNPLFSFLESDYVNDAYVISKNPKVAAINGAIEVDITGQVCADSIGKYQFSGVGGQMDFMRGAAMSDGGKPIISISSITSKGESKIVPFIKEGGGIVSTRAHVHYIVTEFGIAYLFGKNLEQRAAELLKITHPDHQEFLDREIRDRFGKKIFGS